MNFEREDISYDSTVLNMKVDNGHDYENIENILYNRGPRIDMDINNFKIRSQLSNKNKKVNYVLSGQLKSLVTSPNSFRTLISIIMN